MAVPKSAASRTIVLRGNYEFTEEEPPEPKESPLWRQSPFASEEIGIAARAPEFLSHFAHAMAWNADEDDEYLLGQLLASAVLHGALMCESVWQAWSEGLPHHQEEDELLWVEMDLRDKRASRYRWFADPTTRILIIKWRALPVRSEKLSARCCLDKFLARLPYEDEIPDRVSSFANWAIMHWRLRLPPLLVDQALCRLPTTALSSKVWLGVLGTNQKPVLQSWHGHSATSTFAASLELLKNFNSRGSIESKIFEEAWTLRSKGAITRRKEKNFCTRKLTAALPTLSPGRKTLALWAIARLTQQRARPSPKGFAPFTVRQSLYSILEGVYPDTYTNNDFEVTVDGLNAAVQEVIGKLGKQKEQLIEAAQNDFARHSKPSKPLRIKVSEEEELEAFLAESAGDPVDPNTSVSAKIISPRLFVEAVERARDWCSDDQAALIITLGFRAGLRFKEIAGLQVHDFIIKDNDIFELHLQPNRHRVLKTFDSRRILPLDVLLTTHEQDALRKWLEPRRKRAFEIGKNVYCFGPAESRTPIPDSLKFIEKILNYKKKETVQVRGEYKFAHLRHSFGSYLLATLLLPEKTQSSLMPAALKGVVCWDRRKVVADRLLGKERLGQSALHAVSQIMGHTGIYRTLESYQHLLDFVLVFYVSRQALQPAFPPGVHLSLRATAGMATAKAPSGRGFSRNKSRRRHPRAGEYIVPVPPAELPSPTSDLNWRRLDLRRASIAYGLAPLRSQLGSNSGKYPKSGTLLRPWHPRLPGYSSNGLDWRSIWTIVTSPDEDTEELRKSLALCSEGLRKWRRRYQDVITWGFKRQAKREGKCLLLPIGAPALSVVEWMWIRRRSGEIPPSRRPLLKTYLSNFNVEGFYSRMPSLSDAAEFAAFLRQVGVDGRNITIAQGKLSDFKDIKSGKTPAHDVLDDEGAVLYKAWAAPGKFLLKPENDRRPALWISHVKHEEPSVGWSFDMVRNIDGDSRLETGRRFAQHKVNYAYRFALAMMAIVDDEVWDNSD